MNVINDINASIKRTIWLAALLSGCPVKVSDKVDLSEKNTRIDFGYNDTWWNYYSGCTLADLSLVDEIIDGDLQIDWEATSDLLEDSESEFIGTLNPSNEIPILKGILRTKSGAQYPWVSNFKTDFQNLRNLLAILKEYEVKTDEEVIEKLKKRFTKIKSESFVDSTTFALRCTRIGD